MRLTDSHGHGKDKIYLYKSAGAYLMTRTPPGKLVPDAPPDDLRYAWKKEKGWTFDVTNYYPNWVDVYNRCTELRNIK